MSNIDKQDIIDNYLLNRMSETERQNFESEMVADSQLKESVDLQRLLIAEIKQQAFISGIITETKERMNNTKKPHISFRQIMMVTWSAAAIFIGVFFVNQTITNYRMDSQFALNYTAPEVEVMRGGEANPLETEFLNATKLISKQPEQALNALLKLYSYSDTYSYYEDVRWYLALTELKLHHKSEAKKYLHELVDSEFYGEKVKKVLEKL
jgi:hypothetical protein